MDMNLPAEVISFHGFGRISLRLEEAPMSSGSKRVPGWGWLAAALERDVVRALVLISPRVLPPIALSPTPPNQGSVSGGSPLAAPPLGSFPRDAPREFEVPGEEGLLSPDWPLPDDDGDELLDSLGGDFGWRSKPEDDFEESLGIRFS